MARTTRPKGPKVAGDQAQEPAQAADPADDRVPPTDPTATADVSPTEESGAAPVDPIATQPDPGDPSADPAALVGDPDPGRYEPDAPDPYSGPPGTSEAEAPPDADPAPEPAPDTAGASVVEASPAPHGEPQVIERVTVQKVGLGQLIAGGAIAALLGGLVGWLLWGQQVEALDPNALDEQAAQIADLDARIDALPAPPDPAAIAESAAGTLAPRLEELSAGITSAEQAIAALDERIGALERAPNDDGTLADEAIAAWEDEIAGLRDQIASQADQIAAQSERIDTMASEAEAERQAQAEQAAALEESAAAAADRAAARGALSRVQAALETGGPFAEPLNEYAQITGAEMPAELSGPAEEGVPSLADLTASFPAAARDALQIAREQGLTEDEAGGLGSLFRTALQVRSTEPREGPGPDAVLSRAEAALRDGRLSDALAELATLPDVVRAGMDEWIAAAESRQAAIAAADSLSAANIEN